MFAASGAAGAPGEISLVCFMVAAVFVVEDDAQGGGDHVDAHRSIVMVASPYAKRNVVAPFLLPATGIAWPDRRLPASSWLPPARRSDVVRRQANRSEQPGRSPGESRQPIPGHTYEASAIKHVFFIMRENHSYDQIPGDLRQADGDRIWWFSVGRPLPIPTANQLPETTRVGRDQLGHRRSTRASLLRIFALDRGIHVPTALPANKSVGDCLIDFLGLACCSGLWHVVE